MPSADKKGLSAVSTAAQAGALPSQAIQELTKTGAIAGASEEHISPSSLDLTVSNEVYRVEGIFLPESGETVRDTLAHVEVYPHDLTYLLERDVTYLFKLNESLDLPDDIYGYCNPKSTTGRNDVHVRVLADRVSRYDTISPAGYRGELWVAVTPKSFPIRIEPGTPLSQLRLFNADTRFREEEMSQKYDEFTLLYDLDGNPYTYKDISVSDRDGSLLLSIDLGQDIVGYECRGSNKVLDFTRGVGSHTPADFFQPIPKTDLPAASGATAQAGGRLYLKQGSFYILSSLEAVRVPPDLACEMVPMDERSGEFRSHYAGFIDPGWGWGKDGSTPGRPLTLEVRPFEDMVVRHGQPIGKIRFEYMQETPEVTYDTKQSNYLAQTGPKLSKHFA